VFYACEKIRTAVAELSFYRLLFCAESPDTPFPDAPTDFSAFYVPVKTLAMVDLSTPAFIDPALRDLVDYAACQNLAGKARRANAGAIRYISVRDPERGFNLSILTPGAFASKQPTAWQTWRINVAEHSISAICDFPRTSISYDCATFAADSRLTDFRWQR
jgi:RES domain